MSVVYPAFPRRRRRRSMATCNPDWIEQQRRAHRRREWLGDAAWALIGALLWFASAWLMALAL